MVHGLLEEGRLYRLLEVGRTLVGTLDLDELLERVLDTAREVTGARYAALGVLDEQREQLERFLTRGVDAGTRAEIGELPRGRGILGLLIEDPRPLRIDDLGRHPRSYGLPPGHPPMRTFLGAPIVVRGAAWGNLYLTEKEGGEEFDSADEQALVILAEWAALAIDNARLYNRADERRRELERAVQELEATTAIARALAGETDVDRVLELIAKRGRALVEASAVAILLAEGDELVMAAVAGEIPEGLVGRRVGARETMAGEVVRSGRATRIGELAERRLGFGLREQDVSASAGLLVPISFRGRVLGALGAFDRTLDGPDFSERDERVLCAFASSAGAAVLTAQSVARDLLERSIAASETERRRWARELHDETLQDLAGLRLQLSSARRGGDPQALETAVDEAIEQVSESVGRLRHLIAELRPRALDELGLGPALESLVAGATSLEVTVRVDLERNGAAPRLHGPVETAVYRVAQEAVTNARKHAGASTVRVELTEEGDEVCLRVRDDGRGFDPGAATEGFGLVGMRERVEHLGGRLTIESAAGAGTIVSAHLPVAGGPVSSSTAPTAVPARRAVEASSPRGEPPPRATDAAATASR